LGSQQWTPATPPRRCAARTAIAAPSNKPCAARCTGFLHLCCAALRCAVLSRVREFRLAKLAGQLAGGFIASGQAPGLPTLILPLLLAGRHPAQAYWSVVQRGDPSDELPAMEVVERLLAAGYRPTVWRIVAPPYFLGRTEEVVEVFDPIDHYSQRLSQRCGLPPSCQWQPCLLAACHRACPCLLLPGSQAALTPGLPCVAAGWCLWRVAARGALPPTTTGQTLSRMLLSHCCWPAAALAAPAAMLARRRRLAVLCARAAAAEGATSAAGRRLEASPAKPGALLVVHLPAAAAGWWRCPQMCCCASCSMQRCLCLSGCEGLFGKKVLVQLLV
jgi:hypothetical protein